MDKVQPSLSRHLFPGTEGAAGKQANMAQGNEPGAYPMGVEIVI
jgi:hypothetical protein